MPELTQDAIKQAHHWFAVECNNRAWELTASADKTAEHDREMLLAAYASAFHWSKIGQPINNARAELLLAHVHAMLGHAELARQYAERCLAFFQENACEDWDMAFAHAEMAFAAAVCKDAALHATHYALAEQHGRAIKDEQDRAVFFEEFARIPKRV